MRLILNLIWFVLAGLWLAIGYALIGLLCCLTIIGIPFGIACFRISAFTLWPFGRRLVRRPNAGVGSALGNVVWIILAGLWLALGHLISGIALCCTIIGIPLGLANFKLIPVAFAPLGHEIVSVDDPRAYAFVG